MIRHDHAVLSRKKLDLTHSGENDYIRADLQDRLVGIGLAVAAIIMVLVDAYERGWIAP